jgi:D-arabinose 1-dehydrogenase-like Zn-dependent alcohol dehydrogenase
MASRAGLHPGDTVLVEGASGGVGSMTVQFAAQAGAHVLAVARQENATLTSSLGAAETIDQTSHDVAPEVLRRHPTGSMSSSTPPAWATACPGCPAPSATRAQSSPFSAPPSHAHSGGGST